MGTGTRGAPARTAQRGARVRLTHALDVERVHDGALVLVACDGPLEGLLLHDLVALLVLHLGILVVGLHLHHLVCKAGKRGQNEGKRLQHPGEAGAP